MSKKLDDALHQFADYGTDRKDEVLENVMQKVNSPVRPKFRYSKHIIAAVSLCLIIATIGNFNVIASSINKIRNTLFPAETIMMNELSDNTLQDIIDTILSDDFEDKDSLEYQILFGEVETPCYVYLYYYRGYLKVLTLDEKIKNFDKINEWLKNRGVVAIAAETPEEAAKLFESGSSVRITPAQIREEMGNDVMLPGYLPDGRKGGNIIQYNEHNSNVHITYFYEGSVNFRPESKDGSIMPNYIALGITDTNAKFGKNLIANLAVSKNIEIIEINGWDVYISDGYYVWKANGFVYVLYTTNTTHEENIKIIENMK